MPKTPHTSFRLDPETKERLRKAAEAMGTTMTEAIRTTTVAMEGMTKAAKVGGIDASEYPFEAFTEGMWAYRDILGLEPGQLLPKEVDEVVQAVIAASWPIICTAKIDAERRRVLVDVIQRLEGFGSKEVSDDVVRHFWGLLNAHDEAVHAADAH